MIILIIIIKSLIIITFGEERGKGAYQLKDRTIHRVGKSITIIEHRVSPTVFFTRFKMDMALKTIFFNMPALDKNCVRFQNPPPPHTHTHTYTQERS